MNKIDSYKATIYAHFSTQLSKIADLSAEDLYQLQIEFEKLSEQDHSFPLLSSILSEKVHFLSCRQCEQRFGSCDHLQDKEGIVSICKSRWFAALSDH